VIVVTVALTAARFLPMTVALLPMLRTTERANWRHYAAVHLLAMTGWAASMRWCPELPPEQRLSWFVGFALTNWLACIVSTAVGYELAESLPPVVRQGLVFVGPLYFVLILSGEMRTRQGIAALACGAAIGPPIHLVAPQWSVMLAGLIGGTLAFALVRGAQRA
jgi:predicted branched-subunit amino acid permease